MDVNDIIKNLKSLKDVEVEIGESREPKGWLSTGLIALDWMVSNGRGLPLGKVAEIFGDSASGKSYLAYRIIGTAQKKGFHTVLFDVEASYDKSFGAKCGVDNNNIIIVTGNTVEKIYSIIDEMLDKIEGRFVFVWDSIAATPTEKEMDDGMDVKDMTKAQMIGKGMRMITQKLDKTGSLLLVLNQLREKMDMFSRDKEFAPGGRSIEYHSSLNLELKRRGLVVEDKSVKGYKVHGVVTKNRVGVPFREVDIVMRWDREEFIPWHEGLLDILIREGKVIDSSGWYRFYNDDKKWRASDFMEMLYVKGDRLVSILEETFGSECISQYIGSVEEKDTVEEKGDV